MTFSVRYKFLILILSVVLVCPTIALTQDETYEDEPITPEPTKGIKGYGAHAKKKIDYIVENQENLWGTTTLLVPEGIFSLKFVYNYKRANSRYGNDGKYGPLIDPISLDDPFGGGGDFFTININAKGHGAGYLLSMYYGVTDPIDIYATFVFQTEELWLNLDFDPGTSTAMGIRTKQDLYQLLELLGRPRPKNHYKSKAWELGDFHFGMFWNYFRNKYFSGMIKPYLVLPTGRMADPNNALMFALGPEIDVGKGSFAPSFKHNFDLRPPAPMDFISWGNSIDYKYYMRGARRTPRFLTPDPNIRSTLDSLGVDTSYFPDLSGIDDYYYVTPGSTVEIINTITFSVPVVSFGTGYGYLWGQQPKVDTSSRAFKEMLDVLNAYNDYDAHTLSGLISVQLFRISVPAILNFEARFPMGGHNQLRFQDDYKGEVQVFLPF